MCVLCKESDGRLSQWVRGACRPGPPGMQMRRHCGQWRAPGAGTASGHVFHYVTAASRRRWRRWAALRATRCFWRRQRRGRGVGGRRADDRADRRGHGPGECAAPRAGPVGLGADPRPASGLTGYVTAAGLAAVWGLGGDGLQAAAKAPLARGGAVEGFLGHLTPPGLETGLGWVLFFPFHRLGN